MSTDLRRLCAWIFTITMVIQAIAHIWSDLYVQWLRINLLAIIWTVLYLVLRSWLSPAPGLYIHLRMNPEQSQAFSAAADHWSINHARAVIAACQLYIILTDLRRSGYKIRVQDDQGQWRPIQDVIFKEETNDE